MQYIMLLLIPSMIFLLFDVIVDDVLNVNVNVNVIVNIVNYFVVV